MLAVRAEDGVGWRETDVVRRVRYTAKDAYAAGGTDGHDCPAAGRRTAVLSSTAAGAKRASGLVADGATVAK
jgi:hypothetical protein